MSDIVTRLRMRPTIVRTDQFGSLETDRAATKLFDDVHALMREAADEISRLRADLAQRTAERDAAIDNRKISEGALIRTINSVVSQRDALAAEVAALKADPLAEMWRELAEYQPMADRDGHGESWRIMCELRTEEAASSARYVATMARTARDAVAFAEWVMSDKNAARASRAIAAIRRAKEAKP